MYAYIEERVLSLAEYIIEHESTVRAAAREFGISKAAFKRAVGRLLKEEKITIRDGRFYRL